MTTRNRLYLAIAFALNLLATVVTVRNGLAYLVIEAATTTLLCVVVGWLAKVVNRRASIHHGYTLAMAAVLTFGRFYNSLL